MDEIELAGVGAMRQDKQTVRRQAAVDGEKPSQRLEGGTRPPELEKRKDEK